MLLKAGLRSVQPRVELPGHDLIVLFSMVYLVPGLIFVLWW